MVYKLVIVRTAQKQLLSLPREVQIEIAQNIDSLALIPRPNGCKKLHGVDLWRLKLGRYRVVYQVNDRTRLIIILKIALRKEDTYRNL